MSVLTETAAGFLGMTAEAYRVQVDIPIYALLAAWHPSNAEVVERATQLALKAVGTRREPDLSALRTLYVRAWCVHTYAPTWLKAAGFLAEARVLARSSMATAAGEVFTLQRVKGVDRLVTAHLDVVLKELEDRDGTVNDRPWQVARAALQASAGHALRDVAWYAVWNVAMQTAYLMALTAFARQPTDRALYAAVGPTVDVLTPTVLQMLRALIVLKAPEAP